MAVLAEVAVAPVVAVDGDNMKKRNWMKQSRQENLIYLVVWGLLFAAPILSLYVRVISIPDLTFNWMEVFVVWRKFAIYLLLFLVHNFLLAPLLVNKHNRATYFSIIAAIIVIFTVYQCSSRPKIPSGPPDSEMGFHTHKRPPHAPLQGPNHRPHRRDWVRPADAPPPIVGEHDILAVVVLILMFVANVGIKGYFRGRDDRKRLAELERENLEQQLEYLRYQLNPHFLMNTLNNIHALIEIEPPKAQEAVIQLSKILRYVLYESNKKRVLMSQEVDFMQNYVQLMRMRYGDKLQFTAINPDVRTDVYVPPLLFISFVENAFKHGVSYQKESFIAIEGKRYQDKGGSERLRWTCRNSKHRQQEATSLPRQGGVGLANVRQRLSMIYKDRFTLDVHETDNTYEVVMDIPLETTP